MAKYAKKIADTDNVVTAVVDCIAGDTVTVRYKNKETNYKCGQDIPFGHKIATENISKGAVIIKYGKPIGSASQDIREGDWVHTHNVKDDYKCLDKNGNLLPGQD